MVLQIIQVLVTTPSKNTAISLRSPPQAQETAQLPGQTVVATLTCLVDTVSNLQQPTTVRPVRFLPSYRPTHLPRQLISTISGFLIRLVHIGHG